MADTKGPQLSFMGDHEAGLAYIAIGNEDRVAIVSQTIEVQLPSGPVMLDVDTEGRLVGIEFMNAAAQLPRSFML